MVMGLMDKPKRDFEESYIHIDDFILYLAFKLKEPVETVISWLLYNGFDQDITSYNADKHYRIYECKKKKGKDKNIVDFFGQISIDTYHAYHEFKSDIDRESLERDDDYVSPYPHSYKLVDDYFFLAFEGLDKLDYLKDLDLDIREATKYNYTIYDCDNVTVKPKIEHSLVEMGLSWMNFSLEDSNSKQASSTVKGHDDNALTMSLDYITRQIEWAASGEPNPSEEDEQLISENQITNSRNQDSKLIAVLALLLARKSSAYTIGDNKPNATQISNAIYQFAIDDLQIADEDTNGLKANIAKISKSIQEHTDIPYKQPLKKS